MKEEKEEKKKILIAKKDFAIVHNEYVRHIKAGDALDDVPKMYHQNLKTEKVI